MLGTKRGEGVSVHQGAAPVLGGQGGRVQVVEPCTGVGGRVESRVRSYGCRKWCCALREPEQPHKCPS